MARDSVSLDIPQGETNMTELLARIEAALLRSEAAAEKLERKHRALRAAANDTVADLDRMIEAEKRRADG